MKSSNVESPHDVAERVTAKAKQLKEAAVPQDMDTVNALVEKAKAIHDPIDRAMERVQVTPAMGAILWTDHNGYNRDWDPATSVGYANLMTAGRWKINSQSVYALYGRTGDMADGSHRVAAQIISGTTQDVYFCLGMSKDDVATLDCGRRRQPSDTAKLLGVAKAKDKWTLLSSMWSYLAKVDIAVDVVPEADINGRAVKIKEYDRMLGRALEIGAAVSEGAEDPLLKDIISARIATICLHCDWDEERIIQHLSEFQTELFSSETSPMLFARERLKEHLQPADVWNVDKQIPLLIKAMLMTENGVEITSARHTHRMRQLTGAVKRGNWPDPRLERADTADAAE
jgi:hypothetical protein